MNQITNSTFSYWPRYVSRLLRIQMEYRGELMGWKLRAAAYNRTHRKPNEFLEQRYLPCWKYSTNFPWNIANSLPEFIFPNVVWSIVLPTNQIIADRLKPLPENEQLIFIGDRVKILVGPDRGKIGIVSSVIRLRRLLTVEGLNMKYTRDRNFIRTEGIPLNMDNEVSLIDPTDNLPTSAERRWDEEGNLIRISLRTGHTIPFPIESEKLEDLTIPRQCGIGDSDTTEFNLLDVTYKPSYPLHTFEEEVALSCGFEHKPSASTFWY